MVPTGCPETVVTDYNIFRRFKSDKSADLIYRCGSL